MPNTTNSPKGTLRSYLELCRASNLPTVWTNVLAAALLCRSANVAGSIDGTRVNSSGVVVAALLAAIALSLLYLGGMALNDVLDVEEDRVKKPGRPIPSGRISRAGAAAFTVALFISGLLILVAMSRPSAVGAGLLLVAVIYLYDRLHSRSWLTVLLMASCRFLVFIVTALAVAETYNHLVICAASVQFLYIVALTAIARWEKAAPRSFRIPPIPWMLAGISVVDGLLMAAFVSPLWLFAGLLGAAATRLLQTQVRGD